MKIIVWLRRLTVLQSLKKGVYRMAYLFGCYDRAGSGSTQ